MKKFYAVISDGAGKNTRYITVSSMLMGRPSTFDTASDIADAFLFDNEASAVEAARVVINARMGRALSGALRHYAVHEAVDPQSIEAADAQRRGAPTIEKTPEAERRRPESPETPSFHGSMNFLEAFPGAAPKEPLPDTCPTFDWKHDGDELYASLAAIIDSVDYTNQSCRPNEAVGAVLDQVLLHRAKERLSRWRNQCYRFAATANPAAFGPSDGGAS